MVWIDEKQSFVLLNIHNYPICKDEWLKNYVVQCWKMANVVSSLQTVMFYVARSFINMSIEYLCFGIYYILRIINVVLIFSLLCIECHVDKNLFLLISDSLVLRKYVWYQEDMTLLLLNLKMRFSLPLLKRRYKDSRSHRQMQWRYRLPKNRQFWWGLNIVVIIFFILT